MHLCADQRKDEDYDDVVEENLLNEVCMITTNTVTIYISITASI